MTPDLPSAGLPGRRLGQGDRRFVLVHGLGVASRSVVPLGLELAAHGTVLMPDMPGFGANAGSPAISIVEQGATLASAIRRWGGPTVLVGASWGCHVALAAAVDLGQDLEALVLVSPTIDRERRSLRALAPRWLAEQLTQPQALRRAMFQDHRTAGLPRVVGTLLGAVEDRPEQRATRVAAPALVLRGTRDPLVSTRWARFLATCLPDATTTLLPMRHAATFTEPELVADTCLRFLDELGERDAHRPVGRASDHVERGEHRDRDATTTDPTFVEANP